MKRKEFVKMFDEVENRLATLIVLGKSGTPEYIETFAEYKALIKKLDKPMLFVSKDGAQKIVNEQPENCIEEESIQFFIFTAC